MSLMPDASVFRQHQRDWDELAALDPLWAILSDPDKRFGRWDLETFFASGAEEITVALALAGRHGLPRARDSAIDVGCGVGRITRALAQRFNAAVGVDISPVMVEQARALNRDHPNCNFVAQGDPRLPAFEDASADLLYSNQVLQHLPTRRDIAEYIANFMRVLTDGGVAIFQVPTRIPVRHRLQVRRRAYALLRRIRVPEKVLYLRLGLTPIRMNAMADDRVREVVRRAGGEVVATVQNQPGLGILSTTYFVRRRAH